MDHKGPAIEVNEPEVQVINNDALSNGGAADIDLKSGTDRDAVDMHRLGKRQQFNVRPALSVRSSGPG